MFQNYLKIAFRNLVRNKVYSFINIIGLSLGMAVAMLIFLFVSHEVSFDKFHVNGDRIYKVNSEEKYGEQTVQMSSMTAKLAPILKENNSEVLDFVREGTISDIVFKNTQNPSLKFVGLFNFVDKSFFSVFSFKLKKGDVQTVFISPFSIVISEKIAKQYFGNENPIGKTLLCDSKHLFTVTGVMQDTPSNSSSYYDYLTSLEMYSKMGNKYKEVWEHAGAFQTYLLLNSEESVSKVSKSIVRCGKKTGFFSKMQTIL